jgi:hypothetical protein
MTNHVFVAPWGIEVLDLVSVSAVRLHVWCYSVCRPILSAWRGGVLPILRISVSQSVSEFGYLWSDWNMFQARSGCRRSAPQSDPRLSFILPPVPIRIRGKEICGPDRLVEATIAGLLVCTHRTSIRIQSAMHSQRCWRIDSRGPLMCVRR